jgi:hypothetical protein
MRLGRHAQRTRLNTVCSRCPMLRLRHRVHLRARFELGHDGAAGNARLIKGPRTPSFGLRVQADFHALFAENGSVPQMAGA